MVEEIRRKVDGKEYVILTDYQGLDVAKTADLRSRLRGVRAEYSVIRNRLMRRIVGDMGLDMLNDGLQGPTAVVSGDGDVVEVAKVLKAFIKENSKPEIKRGAFSGTVLMPEDLDKLASLPPRMEMLARAVGTIAAPMSQFVSVLNQKVCSLLYVLQAAKDKKEKA